MEEALTYLVQKILESDLPNTIIILATAVKFVIKPLFNRIDIAEVELKKYLETHERRAVAQEEASAAIVTTLASKDC